MFKLNLRFLKKCGLSYKQSSKILLELKASNLIDYKVSDENGQAFVYVDVPEPDKLFSLLSSDHRGLKKEYLHLLFTDKDVTEPYNKVESSIIDNLKLLKSPYPVVLDPYFLHFTNGHIRQFFQTFASRLVKGYVTLEELEHAFSLMSKKETASMADVFNCFNYPLHAKLLDFLYIQAEGRVSNPAMEAKSAKDLAQWVEKDVTNFYEIEDCWIQVILGSGYKISVPYKYNLSLLSVKKALQNYGNNSVVGENGRKIFRLENKPDMLYNTLKSSVENIKL